LENVTREPGKLNHLLRDVLVALATVTVASVLRLLLAPVLLDRDSFLLFTLAVMISAWKGGWRVGAITTALASLAGVWLFVRPFADVSLHHLQDDTQIVLFAIVGCGISFLAGQLHTARFRAEQEARNATRTRNELAEFIESIDEGFQAFDQHFRLIFMNQPAEKILGLRPEDLVGKSIWDLFPGISADVEQLLRKLILDRATGSCEMFHEPTGRWFAIKVYPFREGISVLLSDISERKNAQIERDRLIGDLQDALGKVQTLRGLIPICAWCKRIRDDKGYWEQIEVYIRNHSEANFSHGVCPDCLKEYLEGPDT
jgi:PAS domain S-box-containing protein